MIPLLRASLLALLLAGCGPAEQTTTAPAAPPPSPNATTASNSAKPVVDQRQLKLEAAGERNYNKQPALALSFATALSPRQSWSDLIEVKRGKDKVAGDWVLAEDGRTLVFPAVQPETEYRVKVSAELLAANGTTLVKDAEVSITTRPLQAMVSFINKGMVVSPAAKLQLPVAAINVAEANIDFFRIGEAQLPQFLVSYNPASAMGTWDIEQVLRGTERVMTGRYALTEAVNQRTELALPIDHAKLREPGVYLAIATPLGTYGWDRQTTYFMSTDLGLHLRQLDNEYVVIASRLSDGKALDGVKVRLLDYQGNTLARGDSDGDGMLRLPRVKDAVMALAEHASGNAIVHLSRQALDISGLDSGGAAYQVNQFHLALPRDLYRPGETIDGMALVRDSDGKLLPNAKVTLRLADPEGQIVLERELLAGPRGEVAINHPLPHAAPTGNYQLSLATAASAQSFRILVEDFMPARIKAEITPPAPVMSLDEAPSFELSANYFYGAPADGNTVDLGLRIRAANQPFVQWPGFSVGVVSDDKRDDYLMLEQVKLDDSGSTSVALDSSTFDNYRQWQSPLQITLRADIQDSGGRPVSARGDLLMWPGAGSMPALKVANDDGYIGADQALELELLSLDSSGTPQAETLNLRIINENRDYYWQYVNGEGWDYRYQSQPYTEQESSLAVTATEPLKQPLFLRPGWYRLELTNSSGQLSSQVVAIGEWADYGDATKPLPDAVRVTLDKPSYRGGDDAQVTVAAPYPGEGVLLVESNSGLLWSQRISVGTDATTFELPIDDEWQRHDLYVSALITQPDTAARASQQLRAIGTAHLPLDRSERKLALELQLADNAEPLKPLPLTIKVANANGQMVNVAVSVVDEGALAVTEYQMPDPYTTYFGRRALIQQLYDNYGEVFRLDAAARAELRYGGDADLLARGGQFKSEVRILTLWLGPLQTDSNGEASLNIDLPDFIGSARISAVAWDDERFGLAEKNVTVASPVIAELAMPRFLARGDNATLQLELRNMTGAERTLDLELSASSNLNLGTGGGKQQITLPPGKKVLMPVAVSVNDGSRRGEISLKLGDQTLTISRQFNLATREPYAAETRSQRAVVKAGEQFAASNQEQGLLASSLQTRFAINNAPALGLASHFNGLLHYPYGCLEQVTSAAMPLLLTNGASREALGLKLPDNLKDPTAALLSAIDQLRAKQRPNGSFGLWDSNSSEEPYLTAYASDFLLRARAAGYAVPDAMLKPALERLQYYVNSPLALDEPADEPGHWRLSVQAYAAYLLAQQQQVSLAQLRPLFDRDARDARSSLPLMRFAAAFALLGDHKRATDAAQRALKLERDDDRWYGDYGSPVRDLAQSLVLMLRHQLLVEESQNKLFELSDLVRDYQYYWYSTQDQAALLELALSLEVNKNWQANVSLGADQQQLARSGNWQQLVSGPAAPFSLSNSGEAPLFVEVTTVGYPLAAPTPVSNGVSVVRRYYNELGKPIVGAPQLKVGQRLVVELTVRADKRMPDALLVDLLPAGLELENPALFAGDDGQMQLPGGINLLDPRVNPHARHVEFRDDRFVAALALPAKQDVTITYIARAVTTGTFGLPATLVEDMYRPARRAIGSSEGQLQVLSP